MKWQMVFNKVSSEGDTKEKVEQKLSGLEVYFGRLKNTLHTGFVSLSRGERWGYKVKVDVKLPGHEVVAEGKSKTLLSAIDQAYMRAATEIKKYMDKLKEHRHN